MRAVVYNNLLDHEVLHKISKNLTQQKKSQSKIIPTAGIHTTVLQYNTAC